MIQSKTLSAWGRSLNSSGSKKPAKKAIHRAVSFAVESLEQRRMLSISGPSSAESGLPYTLNLTPDLTSGVNNWSVNWGDGNTQTITGNPSTANHNYDEAGTFIPSATANYSNGASTSDALGLDTSFANASTNGGGNGKLITNLLSENNIANGVAVEDSGKIIVAGRTTVGGYFTLTRYNADGSIDTTFGNTGVVTTPFVYNGANVLSVAVTGDESQGTLQIYAAGFWGGSDIEDGYGSLGLARFTTNGALDTTFNQTGAIPGVVVTDLTNNQSAIGLAVQASTGEVLISGGSLVQSNGGWVVGPYTIERYSTNGSLDQTFGANGHLATPYVSYYGAFANFQSNGGIVAAGWLPYSTSSGYYTLSSYNADGSTNMSFGDNGIVTTNLIGNANDIAYVVAVDSANRIIIGGTLWNSAVQSNTYVLQRYDDTGTLDPTFGDGGTVYTTDPENNDWANNIAVQSNNQIVVAGISADGSNNLDITRFNSDGSLDTTFGLGGTLHTNFSGGASGESEGNGVANALALQNVGSTTYILLGTDLQDSGGVNRFSLARFLPNNTLSISASNIVTPSGLNATPSLGGVVLSWTGGGNDTSFNIQVSTDQSNWTTLTTSCVGASFTDTSASPNTTYYYQVSANAGTISSGYCTPVPVLTLPAAPTSLQAAPGSSSISLTWNNSANPGSTTISIWRSTDDFNWGNPITSGRTGTSWTDTSVAAGQLYYYQIAASNASGYSAYDGTVSSAATVIASDEFNYPIASTWAGGNTGIGFTGNWTISNTSHAGIVSGLTYSANNSTLTTAANALNFSGNDTASQTLSSSVGAAGSTLWVSFELNAASAYESALQIGSGSSTGDVVFGWVNNVGLGELITTNNGTSYDPSVYAANLGTTYFIVGQIQYNTSSPVVTLYVDPTPNSANGTAPTGFLSSISKTATAGYLSPTNFLKFTSTSGASAAFDELRLGSTYASVAPNQMAAPTLPTGFTVTPGTNSIALSWSESISPSAFTIQRSTDNTNWTSLATVSNALSWTDTNVSANTTYYYRIDAYNSSGATAYTSSVSTEPYPAAPTNLTVSSGSSGWVLNWTSHSTQVPFRIERSWNDVNWSTVGTTTATTWTDSGSATNTTYYYRISAFNNTGSSGYSVATTNPAIIAYEGFNYSSASVWNGGNNGVGFASGWTISAPANSAIAGNLSYSAGGKTLVSAGNAGQLSSGAVASNTLNQSVGANGTTLWVSFEFSTYSNTTAQPLAAELDLGSTTNKLELGAPYNGGPDARMVIGTNTYYLSPTTSLIANTTYFLAYQIQYLSTGDVINMYVDPTPGATPTSSGVKTLPASAALAVSNAITLSANQSSAVPTFDEIRLGTNYASVAPAEPSSPAVPTSLTAFPATNSVTLSWSESISPISFDLQRSTDDSNWTTVTSGLSTTNFTDTGLASDSTYWYRVQADNASGSSGYCTSIQTLTDPVVPTHLVAGITSSGVILSWSSTDSGDTFTIQRSTDSTNWSTLTSGVSGLTYTDSSSLAAGSQYFYRVEAVNAWGVDSPYSNTAQAYNLPATPTNFSIAAVTQSSVTLTWTASTGATGYDIYYSSDGGTTYQSINLAGTSWTQNNLHDNSKYYYKIDAYNGGGNSAISSPISTWTLPAIPTGLAASAGTSGVLLNWNTPDSGVSFKIERSTSPSNWTTPVATVLTGTSWLDASTLQADTDYYYRVESGNGNVVSGYSAPVSTITVPLPPTYLTLTPGTGSITLSWTPQSGGSGFNVLRSTDGLTWTTVAPDWPATTWTDGNVAPDTTYFYCVQAYNSSGVSVNSVSVSTTSIDPPTLTQAASDSSNPVTGTSVVLSVAATDNAGALIYNWTTVGQSPVPVIFSDNGDSSASTATATFTQAGTYDFEVTITNAVGASITSEIDGVVVQQVATSIEVTPSSPTCPAGTSVQFSAQEFDQFNNPMAAQPSFVWTVTSGSGSIDSTTGLYTAPADSSGSDTITASDPSDTSLSQSATVSYQPIIIVNQAQAVVSPSGTSIALSVLASAQSGQSNLDYSWSVVSTPSGAPTPEFTDQDNNDATVTNIVSGTYTFEVGISLGDNSYQTDSTVTVDVSPHYSLNITPGGPISATDQVQFDNAILAHFTCTNINAAATDFIANVNWNDGLSNTSATIVPDGSGFDVTSSYTYYDYDDETGARNVTVTISSEPNGPDNGSGVAHVTINVAPPAIDEPQSFAATPEWITPTDGTLTNLPLNLAQQVNLGWQAVEGPGVIGYEVFENGDLLGNTTTSSYTITGLLPDTSYTFGVRAYTEDGLRSTLATANTTTESEYNYIAAPQVTVYRAARFYPSRVFAKDDMLRLPWMAAR